ncbi:hypothetical protein Tco_0227825 [Tanacetum coccineum]
MVACLEKSEGNADFHEIVDFLTASSVHYALTQIHATVDGKTVVISESSVRSDLHFNDEDGITCLTNDAIFENLALMGYESDSNKLTFQKSLFSPQWKYLIHTILHCLSSKSTSWNEFSTNIASAVICLANGQKFNFSKLIFDEPFNDVYQTPAHTKKVFTNMKRKGKDFSGRVTPLFASMLAPPVVEGEGLGQPSEPQPAPSTTQPRIEEQILTNVPIPNVADKVVFKEWDDRVVRATTTAASLDAGQASGNITKTQSTAMSNDPLSQEIGSGGNTPGSDEERLEQDDMTDFVPPTPYDSPLLGGHTPGSDEGRPNINELMAICINLSNMVLALEQSKTAQDLLIQKLKKKVKRLEKKQRARTLGMKLFKIGTSKRKSLDKEYVSKQGRKSDKTKPMFDDSDFDELDVDNAMENVEGDAKTQGRNIAEQITTAGDTINTASIDVSIVGPLNVSTVNFSTSTAGDIFKDEMMTIADTLIGEASGSGEEQSTEKEKELSEEELQKLLVLVPVEELVIQPLQDLVKERFSTTEPTDDKEKELWVELKRLFELDNDDILWKPQMYMHDPLVWRLYDTCGFHHVYLVRGHDIFKLVEKEYPLTRGTLGLMMVARLLVEADSEMSRELLRKIFYQENRPRQ